MIDRASLIYAGLDPEILQAAWDEMTDAGISHGNRMVAIREKVFRNGGTLPFTLGELCEWLDRKSLTNSAKISIVR